MEKYIYLSIFLGVLLIILIPLLGKYERSVFVLSDNKEEQDKIISTLTKKAEVLHENTFRLGDRVYTANDKFSFNEPYYIIQLYGGLSARCAIILRDPNANKDKNYSCLSFGIQLKELQHEPFPICPKCNHNL